MIAGSVARRFFRVRTLALIAGELGSAALALALAWRMRLTPPEFAELLPTILSSIRVMTVAQAIPAGMPWR